MLVDRFRPASGALGLAGELSADHYWWLALAWENLYPSCAECRSFKGSRFPVREARAEPPATGDALAAERPLLLEPRRDDPEQHLVFAEDGTVATTTERAARRSSSSGSTAHSSSPTAPPHRGGTRGVGVGRGAPGAGEADPIAFDRLFDRIVPFAATRRQFLNTWAQRRKGELDAALGAAAGPVLGGGGGGRPARRLEGGAHAREGDVRRRAAGAGRLLARRQRERDRGLLPPHPPDRADEVRNFKVIGDVDLAPRTLAAATAAAPWLMLLGENGCGKSSLLQATALALMGAEERKRLQLDASEYVRNGTRCGTSRAPLGEPRADRAAVLPRRLQGEDEPKVLLLGYGATRLLPRAGVRAPRRTPRARVENLFDPFSPLGDATDWLLDLDAPTFEAIARALKGLMGLENEDRLAATGVPADRGRGLRSPRPARAPERRLPVRARAGGRRDERDAPPAWPSDGGRRGNRPDRRARRSPAPTLADAHRARACATSSRGSSSSPRPTTRCACAGWRRRGRRRHAGRGGRGLSRSPTCRRSTVSASTSSSPRSTSASTARSTPSSTRCSPSTTC